MLRRVIGLLALAALICACTETVTAQNKPNSQKQIDGDTIGPGEYPGKVMNAPGTTGDFVVRMDYYHPKTGGTSNNSLAHAQQQIAQAQARLASARSPQQQASAMRSLQSAQMQLQRAMQGGANTVKDYLDVTLHAAPNMIVRTANPPQAFDEKGNPKKYTSEELKKLKGKYPNMAGYEADISAVQVGSTVKVTQAFAKKPAAAAPKKDAPTEKEAPAVETHKTQVTTIVVLDEGTGAPTQPGKGNKK